MSGVVAGTEASILAASHLTSADDGAVAVLRGIAKQVDYLLEHDGINESGKFDNVSPSLYLKYCESLGLTPAGRKALDMKRVEAPSESSIAKRRAGAAKLRSV